MLILIFVPDFYNPITSKVLNELDNILPKITQMILKSLEVL